MTVNEAIAALTELRETTGGNADLVMPDLKPVTRLHMDGDGDFIIVSDADRDADIAAEEAGEKRHHQAMQEAYGRQALAERGLSLSEGVNWDNDSGTLGGWRVNVAGTAPDALSFDCSREGVSVLEGATAEQVRQEAKQRGASYLSAILESALAKYVGDTQPIFAGM